MQTARSVGGPKVHKLNMLAQSAGGTRHSHPHVASELRRAAETACTQAGASPGLAAHRRRQCCDARHLVDDHRKPRQKYARESIDGLCKQGTNSEGQLPASRALSKRKVSKCVQLTQGAGLKNRGRGVDVGGSHHESRTDERWQPRSLPPASTQRTPRRIDIVLT